MQVGRNRPGNLPQGVPGAQAPGTPMRATGPAAPSAAARPAAARMAPSSSRPGIEPARPASVEELASSLHARIEAAEDLLRSPGNVIPAEQLAEQAGQRLDASENHPLYGDYLREWLVRAEPEPGKAFLGFLRSTLGDLRTAIAKPGSGSKPGADS